MVLFHKFYLFDPKFKNEQEIYTSAIACLFISTKVCNQLVPLNDLVKEFLKNINKTNLIEESSLLETSERICFLEFEILNKIGFDLNIDLPYKYMDLMVNYVLNTLRNPKFLVIATNFLNDSFKLPLSLYYSPKLLALAGIYMTMSWFKVKLPDFQGLKWYQIIDRDVYFDSIVEVANYIKKIYEYSSQKSSSSVKIISGVKENVYKYNFLMKNLNESIEKQEA